MSLKQPESHFIDSEAKFSYHKFSASITSFITGNFFLTVIFLRLDDGGLLDSGFLTGVDLVTQTERHALGLGTDSDVPGNRGIGLVHVLLQTDIGQGVFAEDTLGVKIGGHEATLSRHGLVRGQGLHVGGLQE